jgi:hypothetical protein
MIAAFIFLRTAFLTTLETPEPRYVLVCFPALMAMGAQVFGGSSDSRQRGLPAVAVSCGGKSTG